MQAESWKEETQEVILGITVASAGVRMSNKHTANYLVTQYKFLFLPSWETQQMVKNARVSLQLKQQD